MKSTIPYELYEQQFEEIDKLWTSNYGDCHYLSFSLGFQEGVDWVYKKMIEDMKSNDVVSEKQMKEFLEEFSKNYTNVIEH